MRTSGARTGSLRSDTGTPPVRPDPIKPATTSHAVAKDGARIYFETFASDRDSGQGWQWRSQDALPVLLVMGLGANGRLWAPAVRRYLAAGYHVITFDNRGCGRSSTPWRAWTTRMMAADALAVLDQLEIGQAHVCGASLGGMVAQELALEFPERVSTLVLAATTGGFRRLDLAPAKALLRMLDATLRSLQPGSDQERQVRDFLRMAASASFAAQARPGDEAWDAVAAMLKDPASQRGLSLQMLACLRHSTWSRLPELRLPVQIHHGSRDALIPLATGRQLARSTPGARFELHPQAGHGLFESAQEVADRVLDFLADHESHTFPGPGATRRRATNTAPSLGRST